MKPITREAIAKALCNYDQWTTDEAGAVWALLHEHGREGRLHEGVIEEGDWAVYPDEPDLPGGRRVLVIEIGDDK